jgi:uncharacterized protein (TIGR02808 family)
VSTLESIIWHVLGYAAIPVIVLAGLVGSTLVYFLMLKLLGQDKEGREKEGRDEDE